ncbi:hypothetical protein E2K80_16260 [Rhodophyticola sp. CCM32]|uniref:hypothetical protein n=1 Tax=Rhodophyticola sp. CCM32 TaxID=2916397 RepID=UPI00107F97B8|nr:hypothetical protein [Rhodophyticola sp. CCM32]QBY02096.1 hypothetical protein E2K80_16260 [Rhodophyticola sp. CCM32]
MSIWTSKPYLLAGALALSGCGGLGPYIGETTSPAPGQVAVTSDRVVVTGPDGFCVDPTATRDSGVTAFVLMGNCAAISNSRRAPQPIMPAVLTASISEPSDGGSLRDSIPELDAFFRSDEGLGLLSRSQDPATVTILDSFHQGDIYFLHARDSSEGSVEGVGADYWRAYMDVDARIATLSVLAPDGQEMSEEASLTTLRNFASAITAANSGDGTFVADPIAPLPPPMPVTTPRPQPSGALWNVGLFRRILG